LTPAGAPSLVVPIVIEGNLAVDFFFVLSGFILTHSHLTQVQTASLNARQFFVKRLARIYPMHLATLLFLLALVVFAKISKTPLPNPERYDGFQFLLNLFLVQAWQRHDMGAWNFPSWSVSAEWFAYLLFPLLSYIYVVALARLRSDVLVAASVILLIVCWALSPAALGSSFFELHSNFGCVRILPEFTLGIALYRLGTERSMNVLHSRWAVTLVALLTLIFILLRWDLPIVLVMTMLILAVAETARQGRKDFLTTAGMVYLGEISYSIYMIHVPISAIVFRGMTKTLGIPPAWSIPMVILVVIGLAAATHRLIESPGRRVILLLARKRGGQARLLPDANNEQSSF
jgi:peptidoglycan/LPS O-acetylase OafA/YrhL